MNVGYGFIDFLQEYDLFGWWVGEMKGAIGIVPKEYLLELYAM